MARRLYGFVDESGNHSRCDCYTVIACWCVSDYDAPSEVLKPTKRKIASNVVEVSGELKGTRIEPQTVSTTIKYMENIVSEGCTIDQYNLPWGGDYPIYTRNTAC